MSNTETHCRAPENPLKTMSWSFTMFHGVHHHIPIWHQPLLTLKRPGNHYQTLTFILNVNQLPPL